LRTSWGHISKLDIRHRASVVGQGIDRHWEPFPLKPARRRSKLGLTARRTQARAAGVGTRKTKTAWSEWNLEVHHESQE
jgi:hypothetical protein